MPGGFDARVDSMPEWIGCWVARMLGRFLYQNGLDVGWLKCAGEFDA